MSHLLVPGIAFAIASSPATFKLTRKVAGPWVSSFEGVATPAGLFLHTLFFLFILYLVGRFMPRKSGFDFNQLFSKKMSAANANQKIAAQTANKQSMKGLFGF
jgi:hypothetical protein